MLNSSGSKDPNIQNGMIAKSISEIPKVLKVLSAKKKVLSSLRVLLFFCTPFLVLACDDFLKDFVPPPKVVYPPVLRAALEPVLGSVPEEVYLRYVVADEAALGDERDGSSWEKAYTHDRLKEAIDQAGIAASDTRPFVVLIGPGEYYVEGIALNMKNNVTIAGGIATDGNLSNKKTIINGDLANSGIFNNEDLDNSAILYGITIQNEKESSNNGGGMKNSNSSPTLVDVVFSKNAGGAMNNDDSSPILRRVTFSDNENSSEGAAGGGAMYNRNSSPILTEVVFSNNKSKASGGAMYNRNSSPILTQVAFSGNSASVDGGAMYNIESSSPILTQVAFSGNSAGGNGGAMHNRNSSSILAQVTFFNNTVPASKVGGGIYSIGDSSTIIANSIFWDNSDPIYMDGDSRTNNLNIYNSIVSGADYRERFTERTAGSFRGAIKQGGITSIDPSLTEESDFVLYLGAATVKMPVIRTGSSAINEGLYLKRSGRTLYYSEDAVTWYESFAPKDPNAVPPNYLLDKTTSSNLPSDAIDLTAIDISGTARTGRPDLGAYEAR